MIHLFRTKKVIEYVFVDKVSTKLRLDFCTEENHKNNYSETGARCAYKYRITKNKSVTSVPDAFRSLP